jgi:hypothetical protein
LLLQNEQHARFHGEVDSLFVNRYSAASLGIGAQYEAYRPALDVERTALDILHKSVFTVEISAQDHVRDGVAHGFAESVDALTHHFDPEKREAANRLSVLVKHYGNIAAKTIDKETEAIDDLLRECGNATYQPLVERLGLGEWLAQLNRENEHLKALMERRYEESANRPHLKMKAARAAVDKAYRAMIDQVEALILVNGVGRYQALANDLNAIAERYKTLLAQHLGRNKKEADGVGQEQ